MINKLAQYSLNSSKKTVSAAWRYALYAVTIYGILFAASFGISNHRKQKAEREFEESLVPVVIDYENLKPLGGCSLEYPRVENESDGLEEKIEN